MFQHLPWRLWAVGSTSRPSNLRRPMRAQPSRLTLQPLGYLRHVKPHLWIALIFAAGSTLASLQALAQPASRASALFGQSNPAQPAPAPAPTAQQPGSKAQDASTPVLNSSLDGRLMYQLLAAELALAQGDNSTAFDWMLDAARRTSDASLFRRATDIALQTRAGNQALLATQAWRAALPGSLDALRLQLQILLVLRRNTELEEPLKALLEQTPKAERPALISALPRFLQRATDSRLVATLLENTLKPYREDPVTRLPSMLAQGQAWLEAGEPDKALALARLAQTLEPSAPGPALLALELMVTRPPAEDLVKLHLQRGDAQSPMRLAYVRSLVARQRYAEAVAQLEIATRKQPQAPAPYLTLGALQLELKHLPEAEAALKTYVQLVQPQGGVPHSPSTTPAKANGLPSTTLRPEEEEDDETGLGANNRADQGLSQAWLMLAQVAQLRADFATAESWLAKIQDPERTLEVQTRRAAILAKQGKVSEARELIRETPETRPEDLRAKLVAEAAVMRESKRWQDAYEVLANANVRIPDDPDLLYEQAMMAEKLGRPGDMERLLRRVIGLKPDNAHAYNALGYSLADRGERLQEARQLIVKALALMPGDPFITDSLGWVEFRLGNLEEALRLLRQAYSARPDTEIGAHLGEVLWSMGQQEEARQVWRQSKSRDAGNDVLREALSRLHVEL